VRYIGCKDNLLPFIEDAVLSRGIRTGTFADLMAGTVSVGRRFKSLGFTVYSNDILAFSYVFSRSYIQSTHTPADLTDMLAELNALPPQPGFIHRHYSEEGTRGAERPRRFFSNENAARIDAIRNRIDEWRSERAISDDAFYGLLACLLEAVPGVSNTSGTYGAFLKHWDPRALKPLVLESPGPVTGPAGFAYRQDAADLAGKIVCDVLYLDPPYNTRQYASNYHILETIARWDNPAVYGVSGLRPWRAERSAWCRADSALMELGRIVSTAQCRLLLLSYNCEGIMPRERIVETLQLRGTVEVLEQPYRRYRSDRDRESRRYASNARVRERLYVLTIEDTI